MFEAETLARLTGLALGLSVLGCSAAADRQPISMPVPVSRVGPPVMGANGSNGADVPTASADIPVPKAPAQAEREPEVAIGDIHALGGAHETPENWEHPSVGSVIMEAPPDSFHALPRVIIDVPKSSGSLKKAAIEAHARSEFWGRVIECYRPGALKDQALRGETSLRVTISKGELRKAKVVSPMPDKSVSACFAKRLVGLKMPQGRGSSSATMKIHVAPGDEPMAPADEDVTRGPGQLDVEAVRTAMVGALPQLAGCYREARQYTPELRGWLSIRLQIAKDGAFSEVVESGTHFPGERLTRCTLREVRKLRVRAPIGGPVRAFVPLSFDPGPTPHASPVEPTVDDGAGG